MTYKEQLPEVRLGPFVECFWSVETSTATDTEVPPDGCVDIVFSSEFGLRAVGAMTIEQVFTLRAGTQFVGVRFRPGMAQTMLGVPLDKLTDTAIQLEELWPQRGTELKALLAESESAAQQIKALQSVIKPPSGTANSVQRAIQAICSAHGNVHLDDLVSQTNLSSRQFRRRCHEESGLTPKRLCRILRFRHARKLADVSQKPNWSKIAAETGYFDQAHLIRDFREFTGRTPMSVLSNTRPLTPA